MSVIYLKSVGVWNMFVSLGWEHASGDVPWQLLEAFCDGAMFPGLRWGVLQTLDDRDLAVRCDSHEPQLKLWWDHTPKDPTFASSKSKPGSRRAAKQDSFKGAVFLAREPFVSGQTPPNPVAGYTIAGCTIETNDPWDPAAFLPATASSKQTPGTVFSEALATQIVRLFGAPPQGLRFLASKVELHALCFVDCGGWRCADSAPYQVIAAHADTDPQNPLTAPLAVVVNGRKRQLPVGAALCAERTPDISITSLNKPARADPHLLGDMLGQLIAKGEWLRHNLRVFLRGRIRRHGSIVAWLPPDILNMVAAQVVTPFAAPPQLDNHFREARWGTLRMADVFSDDPNVAFPAIARLAICK